ncbi:MAG: GNAT family N-acetyltransferase, partial [Thermoplasmata archaeon]|nr:GNAT family N-acetyltransferase [Thermoplasmata archaeon]NIS14160.1 GNAT family N-acetyltransferase [Thermoplasmata archaeon]NIS21999.1 GNAT family N-acetyltransferase [Thermoplasmata archaeon]NIT79858.1 GNAT family N-acetyltransferase [Thermoplasmata archaeon]NIU51024.1 GNAT family N-acetyltransferase [Thermoplasmata archaeon]
MSLEFEGELVIEMATDEEWEEMMPGFVEGTYMAIGAMEREEMGPATLRERCAMQAEWIRGPQGFFNQAFVGRTADGALVGHVWVARVLNQFTGRSEAMVLNLYVEEDFRGRGAAKRLMDVAEEWARGQDLDRIGLSVAVDNEPAVRLYEEMGYSVENQRMS